MMEVQSQQYQHTYSLEPIVASTKAQNVEQPSAFAPDDSIHLLLRASLTGAIGWYTQCFNSLEVLLELSVATVNTVEPARPETYVHVSQHGILCRQARPLRAVMDYHQRQCVYQRQRRPNPFDDIQPAQ